MLEGEVGVWERKVKGGCVQNRENVRKGKREKGEEEVVEVGLVN